MKDYPRKPHWLCPGICLFTMLIGGCALHSVSPVKHDYALLCRDLPAEGRKHVYIFLVQGEDMLDCCNLSGLKKELHRLGFAKIWLGQCFHKSKIQTIIREKFYKDPDARFVLIGHGIGATVARDIACELDAEGMYFDRLVYLGGVLMNDQHHDVPCNVVRTVHIRGWGCFVDGCDLAGADNHVLDVHHSKVATHPKTVNMLAFDLAEIAGSIPAPIMHSESWPSQGLRQQLPVTPSQSSIPGAEQLLPPREQQSNDGWSFLNPRVVTGEESR